MDWAPAWLGRSYSHIYAAFGEKMFTLDEALGCLRVSREQGRVLLSELTRRSYLKRVGRGRYVAKTPTAVVFEIALGQDSPPLRQRVYEPLLREVLVRLFEEFGADLVSVTLYGSIARGVAQPTSDMDLFVVIRGLPLSFYDRAAIFSEVLGKLHEPKMRLWREAGRYVNIDILPFTPEEAEVLRPLYLDFLFDALVLFDRRGFMHAVLERLRKRIAELGARRVTLPSGKWYWQLAEHARKRIEIEL